MNIFSEICSRRCDEKELCFVIIDLEFVLNHPCSYVRNASGNGGEDFIMGIEIERKIQLSIISVYMILNLIMSKNGTKWNGVDTTRDVCKTLTSRPF